MGHELVARRKAESPEGGIDRAPADRVLEGEGVAVRMDLAISENLPEQLVVEALADRVALPCANVALRALRA